MSPHRTGRPAWLPALVLSAFLGVLAAPTPAAADPGWLGVNLQPLDDDLREALELGPGVRGVLVNRVVDDGPADRAGVRADDVLVEIGGRRVESVDEAVDAVRARDAGETVRLVVNRGGGERGLSATLGAYSGDAAAPRAFRLRSEEGDGPIVELRPEGDGKVMIVRPKRFEGEMKEHAEALKRHAEAMRGHHGMLAEAGPRGFLGVTTQGLEKQLAEYFGAEEGHGVLVTSVVEESAAERAGLRAGDVILAVDGEAIAGEDELRTEIRRHDPEETVAVEFLRDRDRRTVQVTLGRARDVELFAPGEPFDVFVAPEAPDPPEGPGRPAPEPRMHEPRGLDRLAPHFERLDRELEERLRELELKLQELERKLEDKG